MIIQQNVFFLKKWPPGSTRSVSWAPHLKWLIVLLFAVFRCASTDRKSLLKQRNKKNKKRNLLLRYHLSCVNSLIRNKLSFGGRGEAYGEGGGGKEKDLQSTVEAAFFPLSAPY